jgi:hypothetical protein
MLVTKAIRDPSGEKLGELANPTFAILATESSTSLSSTTGFLAVTINIVETDRAAMRVVIKTIRGKRPPVTRRRFNCVS